MQSLVISQIETLGTVDGPGLRTVFFLQGCAMSCLYCHNPETQDKTPLKEDLPQAESLAKTGLLDRKRMTVDDILAIASRYKNYYDKEGGLTFSGGDPLLQTPALLEIFPVLKAAGYSICLDTSGVGATPKQLQQLLPYVDHILLDLKAGNDELHRTITGLPLSSVRHFHEAIASDAFVGNVTLRHVAVPGLTGKPELLPQLVDLARPFAAKVMTMEILPYHRMGESKYKELGLDYRLDGVPAMDVQAARNLQTEWRRLWADAQNQEHAA